MAEEDYKIYTVLNSQRKVTVEVIGETPEAKQRGVRKYQTLQLHTYFGGYYDRRN